ncbi:MAG: ABC transporter ATP-binding protein [Cyanobacteriota bacterium]|nr:ABC transporter ATP-binding protein [Cyanobacteriota bacterium]
MIHLERVSRRFGALVALREVSLSIGPGEFFSLLGASGCGKTTTLRLIAGFDQPQEGRIWLGGKDLTQAPPHRRPVNLVFQNYALFPHLNVWDNVAFGPRSRRLEGSEIRRRVGETLEVVGLSELARRHPQQLSGGQQQRVALARALVNAPAALLLDEPLAALDPNLRQAMRSELKRIQRDVGIAFLLVTHDREEALSLSDRLAVMHQGRLEQVGAPLELYDQPRTLAVARFMGAVNLLPASDGPGCRLLRPERLHLRDAPPPTGLRGMRARVREVAFHGPTLEVKLEPVGWSAPGSPTAVAAASAPEWIAISTRDNLPETLTLGTELWCVWNPVDTHALGEATP